MTCECDQEEILGPSRRMLDLGKCDDGDVSVMERRKWSQPAQGSIYGKVLIAMSMSMDKVKYSQCRKSHSLSNPSSHFYALSVVI